MTRLTKKCVGILLGVSVLLVAGCGSSETNNDTVTSTDKEEKRVKTSSSSSETNEADIDESETLKTVDESTSADVTTQETTTTEETTFYEIPNDETQISRDRDSYKDDITYDMLARYPDKYEGTVLKTTGKIFQVISEDYVDENGLTYSEYLFYMNNDANQNIYVLLQKDNSMTGRLLENDVVTFYGVSYGTVSYDTVRGNSVTVPLLIAVMYDIDDTSSGDTSTKNPNIAETIVYDGNGIRVTARTMEYGGIFGPSISFIVENNSGQNINVSSRDESINGYMVSGSMLIEVVDGKKAIGAMTFFNSDFEKYGITSIEEIEFSLHIYRSDDWKTIVDTPQIVLKTQ